MPIIIPEKDKSITSLLLLMVIGLSHYTLFRDPFPEYTFYISFSYVMRIGDEKKISFKNVSGAITFMKQITNLPILNTAFHNMYDKVLLFMNLIMFILNNYSGVMNLKRSLKLQLLIRTCGWRCWQRCSRRSPRLGHSTLRLPNLMRRGPFSVI